MVGKEGKRKKLQEEQTYSLEEEERASMAKYGQGGCKHTAVSVKARGTFVDLQTSEYGWDTTHTVAKVILSTMICTLVVCQVPS